MWDLEIKPGAGPSATTLRYAYSAEYDKNLTLQDIAAPDTERLREEFMQKRARQRGSEQSSRTLIFEVARIVLRDSDSAKLSADEMKADSV